MKSSFLAFVKTACQTFSLTEHQFESVTENLISQFSLELPRSVLDQAQNIVSDIHRLTHSPNYMKRVENDVHTLDCKVTPLTPLLCSLDVHVTPTNDLKIIEINTNASGYLINVANAEARGLRTFANAFTDIQNNFKNTIASPKAEGLVAIVDEVPEKQRLYIEFLMYQQMIRNNLDRECVILDPSQITADTDGSLFFGNKKISGIYNRHTDFYLRQLPILRNAHNTNHVLLSPHPWGYSTLADKSRMVDIQNPNWCAELDIQTYPALAKALLKTIPFSNFSSADELWQNRHDYFFKPSDSFGSKSVYNGKSISRKKFDEIYSPGMLAQETAPAPVHTFSEGSSHHTLKYDLRFFFFEDRIQLAYARLYEGQLTNLQSPFGGHAPLVFN